MSILLEPGPSLGALPKLCGADVELANSVVGPEQIGGTGYEASRAAFRWRTAANRAWHCACRTPAAETAALEC